jgi:hypothetical protein
VTVEATVDAGATPRPGGQASRSTDHEFHVTLSNLVNGGFRSRSRALLSPLAPKRALRRDARALAFRPDAPVPRNGADESQTITIQPYAGTCAAVHELRAYLSRHVADALVGAYVHGSVGTYEQIAYSDMDALVVVRSEVLGDADRLADAAYHLNRARQFFFQFDPLQHHGWFAIGEQQLRAYPEWFLPLSALRECKGIVPDRAHTLTITALSDPGRAHAQLRRVLSILESRLKAGRYPRDAYELKVLLSNVMLLPALYLQARDGRGVFKRDSFGLARTDFPADVWSVMDEISGMRLAWDIPVDGIRRMLLTQVSPLRRLGKWVAPPLTPVLREALDDRFYQRVQALLQAFSQSLEKAALPA